MTKAEFKVKFIAMVQAAERIVITTHIRPDGDAISSALSMQMYLQDHLKKESRIVISGSQTATWDKWDKERVIEWVPDALKLYSEADLVIALDAPEYGRFGYEKDEFSKSGVSKICIDHHPDVPDKFDLLFQDSNGAATAQLLYEIFLQEEEVGEHLATILMMGILADTGSFRFVSPQKSRVLDVVRDLVNKGGVEIQTLVSELDKVSLEDMEVIKTCVENFRFESVPGMTGIAYSFLEGSEATDADPEAIKMATRQFMYSFLLRVEEHGFGFMVRPITGKEFSLSFRALPGTVDCQRIAQAFNGGGHKLAAGGEYVTDENMSAEEVCKLVIEKIKGIKDEIIAK